jgi:hypothetical protein
MSTDGSGTKTISMDYRICVKDSEGKILIKPSYSQIVIITLFSVFLISMIGSSDKSSGLVVIGAIFLLGGFQMVQTLRNPPVCINPQSRVVEIGRKTSLKAIPFPEIDCILFSRGRPAWSSYSRSTIKIEIILKNGTQFSLGTMSGKNIDNHRQQMEIWFRQAYVSVRTLDFV